MKFCLHVVFVTFRFMGTLASRQEIWLYVQCLKKYGTWSVDTWRINLSILKVWTVYLWNGSSYSVLCAVCVSFCSHCSCQGNQHGISWIGAWHIILSGLSITYIMASKRETLILLHANNNAQFAHQGQSDQSLIIHSLECIILFYSLSSHAPNWFLPPLALQEADIAYYM